VEVWQKEDDQGRTATVFVCGHAQPRRVSPAAAKERGWCTPSTVGGRSFVCGRSAAARDPRADREAGCPGGMKVCAECRDVVVSFLREAHDARAVREEWGSA
jgi:hypothetical protein